MYVESKVREAVDNLDEYDLIGLWNEYCDDNSYYDDRIYGNDIDELLYGLKPSEVLNAIDLDNYSENDDYMIESIYGYRSFSYLSDDNSPYDEDALVEYIMDNEEHFGYLNDDDISIEFNHNSFVDYEMDDDDIEQFLISNDISFNEDDDEITRADLVKDYLEECNSDIDEIVSALSDLGWLGDIEERVLEYC